MAVYLSLISAAHQEVDPDLRRVHQAGWEWPAGADRPFGFGGATDQSAFELSDQGGGKLGRRRPQGEGRRRGSKASGTPSVYSTTRWN